jgi:threonine dehydrogenase-like Zn-dependent dehydrogenase
MGAQRGLELHVLDRRTEGPKATLVRELGGQPHAGRVAELTALQPNIIMECTGAPPLIAEVLTHSPPNAIVCLLGIGASHVASFDIGQFNRAMVISNKVVFGSVNANRRHYAMAVESLARADKGWLARLISRRVPLSRWQEVLERRPGDIKVVLDFSA